MGVTTEDIVRILQLKGMGRKTAKRFCDLDFSGNTQDLIDHLSEVGANKLLPRFPIYSKMEISEAFSKGDLILEKSELEDITITSIFDQKFPKSLALISDPPLVINTKGRLNELSNLTGIAIIGTRQPSTAGIKAGEYFGKQFALADYNVVSGLAIGCDTSGHKGCLSANGFTTAVLAHGLHTIYPKENRLLAEEILEKGGVLLSEYFTGMGALANFFVERDRLQAGLSQATIVIQTDEKGGTMHAVNATINSGKKLAAVKFKGSELEYVKTRGNEMLIRDGKAFALTSDNLSEFIHLFSNENTSNLPSNIIQEDQSQTNKKSVKEPTNNNISDPTFQASTAEKSNHVPNPIETKAKPDESTSHVEKSKSTLTQKNKSTKGKTVNKKKNQTNDLKTTKKKPTDPQTKLF